MSVMGDSAEHQAAMCCRHRPVVRQLLLLFQAASLSLHILIMQRARAFSQFQVLDVAPVGSVGVFKLPK